MSRRAWGRAHREQGAGMKSEGDRDTERKNTCTAQLTGGEGVKRLRGNPTVVERHPVLLPLSPGGCGHRERGTGA